MNRSPVSLRSAILVALFGLVVVVVVLLMRDVRQETKKFDSLAYRPPVTTSTVVTLQKKTVGQMLYVPVYSHIYAEGGRPMLLETTVSVRNVDPKHSITLKSLGYYGTDGGFIRDFLDGPVSLDPLATAEYLVEKKEISGGSGANFLLEWHAEERALPPLVEAVMVGTEQQRTLAFTSRAQVISQEEIEPSAEAAP